MGYQLLTSSPTTSSLRLNFANAQENQALKPTEATVAANSDAQPPFTTATFAFLHLAEMAANAALCDPTVCLRCGAAPNTALEQCSNCHQAYYCSKDCQSADSNAHKTSCKASSTASMVRRPRVFVSSTANPINSSAMSARAAAPSSENLSDVTALSSSTSINAGSSNAVASSSKTPVDAETASASKEVDTCGSSISEPEDVDAGEQMPWRSNFTPLMYRLYSDAVSQLPSIRTDIRRHFTSIPKTGTYDFLLAAYLLRLDDEDTMQPLVHSHQTNSSEDFRLFLKRAEESGVLPETWNEDDRVATIRFAEAFGNWSTMFETLHHEEYFPFNSNDQTNTALRLLALIITGTSFLGRAAAAWHASGAAQPVETQKIPKSNKARDSVLAAKI